MQYDDLSALNVHLVRISEVETIMHEIYAILRTNNSTFTSTYKSATKANGNKQVTTQQKSNRQDDDHIQCVKQSTTTLAQIMARIMESTWSLAIIQWVNINVKGRMLTIP